MHPIFLTVCNVAPGGILFRMTVQVIRIALQVAF